ncbi:MAG: DNA repair protein RadA [Candidatus Margulisbacteria bacterium]|nr:DNA repair protein RadA [Candidatus Margulisiibacteriota bacterium]MBU1022419.1 DNA repair protein RadA [Candidatus Margulisiibacteriota bacterium]MBU1729029.1 DNA repair protein RadA [Candidatus Margulisiibacteriota bacterium]MBU1954550.1 DNA repair protein RadA [Candidatus Margulisiibacteriota bacterium]
MPKTETRFFCKECGYDSPKWLGKCPNCDAWDSLIEENIRDEKSKIVRPSIVVSERPQSIVEVEFKEDHRIKSGISELDRVLGGGIVSGSVILLSGEPGIGKSTLMLQVAHSIAKVGKVLYVTGEESAAQIKMRAQRLGALSKELLVYPETSVFAVENEVNNLKPAFLIIDSAQTMHRDDIASAPGSISQVRESSNYIIKIAKSLGMPTFIVGHVTKEGNIAGPRLLEHMVDTVLYFEGDRHKYFRLIRATKNRFGSTNEVGVFEMGEKGLIEVSNPSKLFLEERQEGTSGSSVMATVEGTRPLLVELQALITSTSSPVPRRGVTGLDYSRTSIILAVIEKRLGLKLGDKDVYVNVAGGVKVSEPASDLPLAMAVVSCYKNKPLPQDLMVVGEVGLGGEIRAVNHISQRLGEAAKLGFKTALIPKGNAKEAAKVKGIQVQAIGNLKEAVTFVLS